MHRKKRIYKGGNNEYIKKLPLPLLKYKNNYTDKKEINDIDKLLKELNIEFDKEIDNYKEKVKYIFNNRFSKIKRIIDEETNKYKFNELTELIDDLDNETETETDNYDFTKLMVIEEYVNKLNQITDEKKIERLKYIDEGIKKFNIDIPSKNNDEEAKKINCKSLVNCDESMLLGYELKIRHLNILEKIENYMKDTSYKNNETIEKYLTKFMDEINSYHNKSVEYYDNIEQKIEQEIEKEIKKEKEIEKEKKINIFLKNAVMEQQENIKYLIHRMKILNLNIYDILKKNNIEFNKDEIKQISEAINKQEKFKKTIDLYIDYKLKNYNKSILNMVKNISKLLEKSSNIVELYNYYVKLFKEYLNDGKNINSKLIYNCFCFFNIEYNYLQDNFNEKILNKIEIKKLSESDNNNIINDIYFINKNGFRFINTYKLDTKNLKKITSKKSLTFNDIKSYINNYRESYNNSSTDERKHIGDLKNASYYEINFNNVYNYKIILCTLFSKTDEDRDLEDIKQLYINEDFNYLSLLSLYDNTIDNTSNNYFKQILILLKLYIDWHLETPPKTGGSSIKNSYQLYINDKNRYYIIYNNKNIYLNKNNTCKKKNKLYLKINNETEVIIKT